MIRNYMLMSKLLSDALDEQYEKSKPKWVKFVESKGIKVNENVWKINRSTIAND